MPETINPYEAHYRLLLELRQLHDRIDALAKLKVEIEKAIAEYEAAKTPPVKG